MIRNLIFDVDGTLLNTYDKYMPAMVAALAKYGYDRPLPKQLLQGCYGITAVDALQKVGVKPGEVAKVNREWMRLAHLREGRVTAFPGIPALIRELRERGRKLAIVTSRTGEDYDKNFANVYGWAKLFDVAVTADQTQRHKPFPDPLLLALKELNADPAETIYIGDAVTDLQAARAAKIKFAGAVYGAADPQKMAAGNFLLGDPADLLSIS
jgi:HAD superfamily hydrolase (TIGR01662 family)